MIVRPRTTPLNSRPLAQSSDHPTNIDRVAAVDVLYPIYASLDDDAFFRRMRCSVRSLLEGSFKDFVLCVSDTSRESLKPVLDRIIPVPYRYVHNNRETPVQTGYGFFSKPYTINYGVRQLVTAPILKLSDVDIVYCQDHVHRVVHRIECGGADLVTYAGHKLRDEFYSHRIAEVLKQEGEYLTTPGIPTLRTECFHSLRGYNEHPDYVGLEDVDFLMRAGFAGMTVVRNWDGVRVAHLWHVKVWSAEQTKKDKALFRETEQQLRLKRLLPGGVNPKGYGDIKGIRT